MAAGGLPGLGLALPGYNHGNRSLPQLSLEFIAKLRPLPGTGEGAAGRGTAASKAPTFVLKVSGGASQKGRRCRGGLSQESPRGTPSPPGVQAAAGRLCEHWPRPALLLWLPPLSPGQLLALPLARTRSLLSCRRLQHSPPGLRPRASRGSPGLCARPAHLPALQTWPRGEATRLPGFHTTQVSHECIFLKD